MRKLATAVAVSLALASTGVQALGLGDIEMHSALNQPLDAEIIINSVQPNELEGLLVQLASREAFLRAGIERSTGLSDLKFSLDKKSDGTPFIKVGSKGPVVEPFLNFLLEVDWPKGRMVREYTILLDPPLFMNQEAVSSNADTLVPEVGSQAQLEADLVVPVAIDRDSEEFVADVIDSDIPVEEVVIDSIVISSDTVEEGGILISNDEIMMASDEDIGGLSVESPVVVAENEVPIVVVMGDETETTSESESSEINVGGLEGSGDDYTVAKNDTLWAIAANNKPSDISVQQMMLALLRTNEAAFSNGNVNRLKEGAILRMPPRNEISNLSRTEAVAQMVDQNRLWQEYRDSIGRTTTANAPDQMPADKISETSTDTLPADQEEDLTPPADLQGEVADVVEDTAETPEEVVADVVDKGEELVNEAVIATDELNIVADPTTTEGVATPTADETEQPNAALIGQINSDLSLSQEELETALLEKEELQKQESELESNSDKMERLIELRENELAQLQERLSADNAAQEQAAQIEDEATKAAEAAAAAEKEAVEKEAAAVIKPAEPVKPVVPPVVPPAQELTFIEKLMNDPIQAAGIGLGALGILGGLAWFFTRGRRRDEDEVVFEADEEDFYEGDDEADYGTEEPIAEFDDEKTVLVQQANVEINEEITDLDDTDRDGLEDSDFLASAVDDESSKDDTISEADVYLAYGLHGQAEDLLTKAVDRDPENQEYHLKLMETHRSQNKVEEFNKAAENFHARFGGDANPTWSQVAEMGRGLDPSNALFQSDVSSSAGMLTGAAIAGVGAAALSSASEDLADSTVSLNEFDGTGDVTEILAPLGEADFAQSSELEDSLMDQSIDPGMAFDEADLEATGDFSAIAAEVSTEFEEIAEKTIDLESATDAVDILSSNLDTGLEFDTEDLLAGDPVSEELVAVVDDLHLGDDLDLNGDFDLDSLDANELAEKATEAEAVLDSSLSEGLGELGEKADDLSSMMEEMDGTADAAIAASLGSASSLLEEVDLDSLNDTSITNLDDETASLEATTGIDIGETGLDFEESVLDLSSMADAGVDKVASASESVLDGLELSDSPEELTLDLDQLGGVEELDEGIEGLFDHTETLDTAFDQTQELEIPDLTANADLTSHDDSSSFGSTNEMETMLDLAKAYIDMGDNESASSALNEIVKGGSKEQKDAAEQLLKKIG